MAAFALFKFVQSIGSAIAFLYSTKLDLYYQLIILALISTVATIGFCAVEWGFRLQEASIEKSESQQNIVKDETSQRVYGAGDGTLDFQRTGASSRSGSLIRIN